eukprot:tig00020902_g14940.t1
MLFRRIPTPDRDRDAFFVHPTKLGAFLAAVEDGYPANPYHNSAHSADVLQATFFLINSGSLKADFSPLEILAALFAAAVHDVCHTGHSNAFEVATQSEVALLYNDVRSALAVPQI